MAQETKSIPYFEIKGGSEGRIRKGIAAVFGNVDSYGDRMMPGSFTKTITEGRSRIKHLWNHSFSQPPIASIKEIREVGRDELPEAVLEYAPEATGGLMVAREYYKTEFADWILQAIDAGDITEMSFGFDAIEAQEKTENEMTVRELKEVKLFDISDVLWGANAATIALGAKMAPMPLGALTLQLQTIAAEVKAGRRNANNDQSLIDAIHQAAYDLGAVKCLGIKTDETENESESEKAEAAIKSTSLSANRLLLNNLRVQTLTI